MKGDGFRFDLSLVFHLLTKEEKQLLGKMILEEKKNEQSK